MRTQKNVDLKVKLFKIQVDGVVGVDDMRVAGENWNEYEAIRDCKY